MCPMILGVRVLHCPRIGTPSAARNWSPKACSSSLFLGVTTARMARPQGEGVMLTIPLTLGASVRYGQDDQRRHLELLSSFWGEPVSSSRCPLSAQRLRRGGSLLVGDPIDVLARLHESRCYDVSAHALLRPE